MLVPILFIIYINEIDFLCAQIFVLKNIFWLQNLPEKC